MERLKKVIEQYGRWSELSIYTERIEAHITSDFNHAIESAKALLETIGKEICDSKGIQIESSASINSVLKKAFSVIGYSSSSLVTQISTALASIGQQIGDLRNDVGTTSHGKSIEELKERNNKVNEIAKEFLIDTTVIVATFLIRTFENENPSLKPSTFAKKYNILTMMLSMIFGIIPMANLKWGNTPIQPVKFYSMSITRFMKQRLKHMRRVKNEGDSTQFTYW